MGKLLLILIITVIIFYGIRSLFKSQKQENADKDQRPFLDRYNIHITIVIIVIAIVIALLNYQNIYKSVLPPLPQVLNTDYDFSPTDTSKYKIKVTSEITNKGGNGPIVLEVTAHQGTKQWGKTKNVYIQSLKTQKVEILFNETELLNTKPNFEIHAYPLGNK